MNIKAKLIEQLELLEEMQEELIEVKHFDKALDFSKTILEYITVIDRTEPGDTDDEENEPYICADCEDAELEAMMINDISIASGMASEVVRRVLDAQAEVLDLD